VTAVRNMRTCAESFGSPTEFPKLHSILNALQMQVGDGDYQKHAVVRLCEACLATMELYFQSVPEDLAARFERLTIRVVELIEDHR